MTYRLFIDDTRDPPDDTWVVCRTCSEAQAAIVDLGRPAFMSLDHDLGGTETVMEFLRWYAHNHYETGVPDYQVHSANPVGQLNIVAFLESWQRSLSM